jgi:hypothetical protein
LDIADSLRPGGSGIGRQSGEENRRDAQRGLASLIEHADIRLSLSDRLSAGIPTCSRQSRRLPEIVETRIISVL